MQLNEILEIHDIKEISKKTNISEENLEALFSGEFDVLKKVKTMGFISIIEREYNADLLALREEALNYYHTHEDDHGVVLDTTPIVEKSKGRSVFSMVIVLVLLGIASWYFITQFDKKQFQSMLPFNEDKMVKNIQEAVDNDPNLSIEHAIAEESPQKSVVVESVIVENNHTTK
jgi:cytoskeletal protein RodZ